MSQAVPADDGTVANDARFSGGHRDCGLPDDEADSVAESPESAFSGMSAEQRFMMDVHVRKSTGLFNFQPVTNLSNAVQQWRLHVAHSVDAAATRA